MKKKNSENIYRLTEVMKDAYCHPPMVAPDRSWREGVMAEIRTLAEGGSRGTDLFYIPRVLFRVVPLLAAASLVLFIGAWLSMGSLYNDLAVSVLTDLPFLGL